MSLFGIHLTLLIGPTVPVPAPITLSDYIVSAQVTNTDSGRDGFQVTFSIGRNGPADIADYRILGNPLLRVFNRVILIVTIGVTPYVLIDGIITHQQLNPSNEPGQSTLTITGEDVSVMMDMHEKSATYPNQPDYGVVTSLVLSYGQYGLAPLVIPPQSIDVPVSSDWTPAQSTTDYKYIQSLATNNNFVFFVAPTNIPMVNTAYWGPPVMIGASQTSLCFNMGNQTNVNSISFEYDAMQPQLLSGQFVDRDTDSTLNVEVYSSTLPDLSTMPAWLVNQPNVRSVLFQGNGINSLEAQARAQAASNGSTEAVTGTGEIDALSYGGVLRARQLVGLKGVGYSYDGLYYVKSVTHNIKLGQYTQSFTITREGLGSLTQVLP
ncbi:MAG: hypothetical protein OK456_01100 [Thaumarchaeota archaeon]|nr:hypothetical protein [Nitrososphaerota archaeon]